MSEHHHHHDVSGKNLFITIVLNIIITLSQIVGGIFSGSLALLSDAMHNFSDVLALLIAYVANRLAAKENTKAKTFGYKRAEIIAALFNASVLIGIAIFLIIEAFHKFYHPEVINSIWVIGLGLLSIVLNAASVLLIKDDAHSNMNIKAAYLHLLTDVMTSVAVVLGGVLMYFYQIFWIDPLISFLIALYLIWASFDLVKESSAILMQFTPKGIDIDEIVKFIMQEKEIANVHHLHIWKLDDHRIHLEAHLDFNEDVTLSESNKVIDTLEKILHDTFGIEHTTFQCEYNREDDKSLIV
ncbi:cation diffusion facilitator family transporter [Sulfurimonas autotrophica]|uniref:Cation diffusion facilitator family transporter n=1 Tax=Sulfurimonas autotrophica (strain ATCC BAA-671 / DSM 16294 / JCM 11897 / OK10) TaxID=563040 RepID=E0UP94_SULAO|nr:cation diffusion facilitator family transporter [Sulfurimonas autotrophica]ADN08558.1 cation diffusion facilitator family transporter [Sulfurimonas autotrophica DSM 16294]